MNTLIITMAYFYYLTKIFFINQKLFIDLLSTILPQITNSKLIYYEKEKIIRCDV